MDLFLQFGWGMMQHCRHLLRSWGGGTVILSPRDLVPAQLEQLSGGLRALPGGRVLLDPQFYVPRSDHQRLTAHDYWPGNFQTNAFFGGSGLEQMTDSLLQLNRKLGCAAFVLPGLMAKNVDDAWLATLRATTEYAATMNVGMPVYATVALSSDCMRDANGIQDIIAEFESLDVNGAYLLFEHPNGDYIVTDPLWLSSALELSAGLRLLNKTVIVGYANHQLLCLGAASVNAIASGTWMNVRAFSPDRFLADDDASNKRGKAVWYYAPSCLTEYKIPFLDVAQQQGLLPSMAAPDTYQSIYAENLFSGAPPTSVGFGEQESFRHYLQCMAHQSHAVCSTTFDATLTGIRRMLDAAESQARQLANHGVFPQFRGFADAFDPVRSALISLESTRGPLLRRAWQKLLTIGSSAPRNPSDDVWSNPGEAKRTPGMCLGADGEPALIEGASCSKCDLGVEGYWNEQPSSVRLQDGSPVAYFEDHEGNHDTPACPHCGHSPLDFEFQSFCTYHQHMAEKDD